jgi:hypothetical protein
VHHDLQRVTRFTFFYLLAGFFLYLFGGVGVVFEGGDLCLGVLFWGVVLFLGVFLFFMYGVYLLYFGLFFGFFLGRFLVFFGGFFFVGGVGGGFLGVEVLGVEGFCFFLVGFIFFWFFLGFFLGGGVGFWGFV